MKKHSIGRRLKRHARFWVYIVRCLDGAYYTGYTNNLPSRIRRHNAGHGAKSLRGKRPVTLVYAKEYRYYRHAIRTERDLKKLTRKQKEQIIGKQRLGWGGSC